MKNAPIILDEWIPVETPLGKGYAFMIETENHDNWYTVLLDNRSIVTLRQERLLSQRSYSHGRSLYDEEMREIIKQFTAALKEGRRHGDDTRGQSEGNGQNGPRLVRE